MPIRLIRTLKEVIAENSRGSAFLAMNICVKKEIQVAKITIEEFRENSDRLLSEA
jgi:hypothetical protein